MKNFKIKRYKYSKKKYLNLKFVHKKKFYDIDLKKVIKRNKVDGVIKFLSKDFQFIRNKFYHFNLQQADHKKGKKYLILKIKKRGGLNLNKETLPVYCGVDIYIYKCFYIKQKVSLLNVKEKFYLNSLNTTNNLVNLRNSIIRRYKYLLSQYSFEQIINAGVAITGLEKVKKINFHDLI